MASAFLLSVLLLVICSHGGIAQANEAAAGHKEIRYVVVPKTSFQSSEESCSTSRSSPQPGRVSVPLANRNGPCAPFQTKDEASMAQRLHRDRLRTKYITRRMTRSMRQQSSAASTVSVPTRLGTSESPDVLQFKEYLVTVGLGTPAVPQTLLLGTETDLTWVQCKPCSCYPQKLPIFDPSRSSSYTTVPCDSQECRDLVAGIDSNGCTSSNIECGVEFFYGSGANTTGVYSSDVLTLGPGTVIENFHFGCGHELDPEGGPYAEYAGVLGLGRLPESLVQQTSADYGGAFSLCLPPTGASTGFLALGAPEDTSDFVFTPLLTMDDQPWFYQLMLTGISVGGQPLDIPAAVFREGMILSSSVTITGLQVTAYAALRAAFRSAMSEYPLAPPTAQLDTCYNLTGYDNVRVPTVSLTFRGGATVDIDASSGLLLDGCLAFWTTGDEYTGLIGNLNQRTIEVLYDLAGSRVGFRTGAC